MPRIIGLQWFRGLLANLPTLLVGEIAFTTDTKQLWVGSATGNSIIGPLPTYSAAGVLQATGHVVRGSVTLPPGGSATISLTGAAAYTSATSYSVFVTDNVVKRTLNVVQSNGSSFTISGGGTGDVVQYFCVGS